ncbi:LmbU family transcriptional regulator [Streptomyces sp. NPDC038707]|uniref:LmbU family transcriptional regulator n=1 Tax=unclassified Streptomyces TaxID=2593676 RepID=UPI0033F1AE7D
MAVAAIELEATKPLFRGHREAIPAQRVSQGERQGQEQVLTTRIGLHMPTGLSFEDWERAGRQISGLVNSSTWWLGDWLVYGKEHYTDRYQRGIRSAGLQYQTLRNYAWVSRRFAFDRRRPALSFQHHAEVASLRADEQDVWLDRAEQNGWTTKQLRNAISLARDGGKPDDGKEVEAKRQLSVPDSRVRCWHKAAQQAGTDLEQWVLTTLDSAAEQILAELE